MRQLALFLLSFLFTFPAAAQHLTPGNRSHITEVQPTIRADFNTRIRNARIWIDGKEFTAQARTRGETVTLVPPYPLDYGVHEVRVLTDDGRQANWTFAIVGSGSRSPYSNQPSSYPGYNRGRASGITDVRSYGPPASSVVTVPRPVISAAFNGPVTNLRLTVDGRDVTHESVIGNEGISWTPRHNLDFGQHNAQVSGVSANTGQPVSGSWNFLIRRE